jgi:hypothetical protein
MGMPHKSKQQGQSMTEFVIAAATVLVPLFLILPILGKYSDVSLMAPQAARYVAWEHTVWHDKEETLSNGIQTSLVSEFPEKSDLELRQEVVYRFMGDTFSTFDSLPNTTLDQSEVNSFWVDNNRNDLVELDQVGIAVPDSGETPQYFEVAGVGLYDVFEGFNDAVNLLYKPFSWLGGTANFTPNYDGLYSGQPIISVPVENPDYVVSQLFGQQQNLNGTQTLENVPLVFTGNASVLADTWSVQGGEHFQDQTAGLVPLGMARGTFLEDMIWLSSKILFEPNLDPTNPDGLSLGGFDTDPMALDHENGSSDFCDKNGYCTFDDENSSFGKKKKKKGGTK